MASDLAGTPLRTYDVVHVRIPPGDRMNVLGMVMGIQEKETSSAQLTIKPLLQTFDFNGERRVGEVSDHMVVPANSVRKVY